MSWRSIGGGTGEQWRIEIEQLMVNALPALLEVEIGPEEEVGGGGREDEDDDEGEDGVSKCVSARVCAWL